MKVEARFLPVQWTGFQSKTKQIKHELKLILMKMVMVISPAQERRVRAPAGGAAAPAVPLPVAQRVAGRRQGDGRPGDGAPPARQVPPHRLRRGLPAGAVRAVLGQGRPVQVRSEST